MSLPRSEQREETQLAPLRQELSAYVTRHPTCADLALPLWSLKLQEVVSGLSSSTPSSAGAHFGFSPPPIWVDESSSIVLRSGVRLTAYPASPSGAHLDAKDGTRAPVVATPPTAPRDLGNKSPLSQNALNKCATDIARLLRVEESNFRVAAGTGRGRDVGPSVARFKATRASSHWIW
jgi:hypothetical protein